MFLARISNPFNEKEFQYYVITGERPSGGLLRQALWAVGRKYEINFFPTGIYTSMEEVAKISPKVTVGELLNLYSKIKYYKEVTTYSTKTVYEDTTKTAWYPEKVINVNIGYSGNKVFLRFNSFVPFIAIKETELIVHINKSLGISFVQGNDCWHYTVEDNETITLDENKGNIVRTFKKPIIVPVEHKESVLI